MPDHDRRGGPTSLLSLIALSNAILALGCADHEARAPADCQPGDEASCSCAEAPVQGTMLCHAEGAWGACNCIPARTLPCGTPGGAFACRCANGAPGQNVCKSDGTSTGCACDSAREQNQEERAKPGEEADSPLSTVCPADLLCTLQRGRKVCTYTAGVPPFCSSARDCMAAGLTSAECIDPDIGVKVCVQLCQD